MIIYIKVVSVILEKSGNASQTLHLINYLHKQHIQWHKKYKSLITCNSVDFLFWTIKRQLIEEAMIKHFPAFSGGGIVVAIDSFPARTHKVSSQAPAIKQQETTPLFFWLVYFRYNVKNRKEASEVTE